MSEDEAQPSSFRCGFVALIGRPNVGKSSLMNRLIKQKVSIVSSKPQTTRNRIHGILTNKDTQFIFIDTPGLHNSYSKYQSTKQLHHSMNKASVGSLKDADVIIFMVDACHWTKTDDYVTQVLCKQSNLPPVLLALNKIDKIANRLELLPIIEQFQQRGQWQEIIPISALKDDNTENLLAALKKYLPEQEAIYEEDMITDRSMRFMAAEIIREQLTKQLNQELPYGVSIDIQRFDESEQEIRIEATIFTERKGQKAIVIGAKGESIKRIGIAARLGIEKSFDKKTHLNLWVKVRRHQQWDNDIENL
jgi:GTP-binding protein Era